MRKIAIAMAKGGVGKTTTAVNLAHGLAAEGRRVLLVDCDTQGQTAGFLGKKPAMGLYEFITGQDRMQQPVDRREAVVPARDNLWILAGGMGLVELKYWLGGQPVDQRESVLTKSLVPRENSLDYLIFDCAPGWDVLSVNILMAANEVLCPVALQGPCMEGMKTFFRYLLSAQKLNPPLQLRYIVPTLFDRRTRHSFDIFKQLEKIFSRQICEPIRYNVRLPEAASHGQSIFEYAPQAAGAQDYRRLIRRIIADESQKTSDT